MNRPRLAASLLSLAAIVAIGLVLAAPGGLRWQAHPGTACEDLAALSESLDLSSLGDQAVIRARAVQLAAALKVSTADDGEGAVTTDEELQLRVLMRLQTVIADRQATAHDLAVALLPLARRCGVVLST